MIGLQLRFELGVRNALTSDIPEIASLVSDSFDGPFQWYELLRRQQTEKEYAAQFSERYERFVVGGYKHAMIVAIEPSTEAHQDSIIGFMEVGQLPAPVEPRREAPYFGNVAVSANVRRQGIGERLVKIALKLVQDKWKDDIVYVAVDASNTAAVDMYLKCGFQVYKP